MADETALFVGIDLDYTTFATDKFFYDGVLPLLAQKYPDQVRPDDFIHDMEKYRIQHGPAVSYDLFEQIADLGLDSDTVEQLIISTLGSTDIYLLPGAKDFIARQHQKQHDVQLITIGGERFQQLKITCSPALLGLPPHIIMEPKGPYIAQAFPDARGYMIDDYVLEGLPPAISPLYVSTGKRQDLPNDAYENLVDLLARGPADLR